MLYELFIKNAGKNKYILKNTETILLEAQLFTQIYFHLKEEYKNHFNNRCQLFKNNHEKEEDMQDRETLRCVINDLVASGEYTIEGLSRYTKAPFDVVYDIVAGCNMEPSANLFRRLIELHYSVRPALYRSIFKKIVVDIEL